MAEGNRIPDHTFVGRETELNQLRKAFDAAVSGHGALIVLAGEPGIGKTALCEQLGPYVVEQGGHVLTGHCSDTSAPSLPYLPFVDALHGYVLDRDPDALRAELGSGAPDVARLLPELSERLAVQERPPDSPELQRWRLLRAVADFLRAASLTQPFVLFLEDLHNGDRATFDLLVHLSRGLQSTRMLVVGTYRDVEVDRTHPLSSALAELRRSSSFGRLSLRGLSAEEVQHMLVAASDQQISARLTELVYRQTEGNPLFVQELLRYLLEQGLIEGQEGTRRRFDEEDLASRIPEGLRNVIGQRLSLLSPQANQVLAIASVLGLEFQVALLVAVVQQSEDEVVSALDEAVRAGLIDERATRYSRATYRFTHAFFRQTLYEELSPPRRMRWHQQVARVLETASDGQLELHAAALADHFSQSRESQDLEKAVTFWLMASKRATRVSAHGEAARHVERALEVQEVLNPLDTVRRCDLLLLLGDAMLIADLPRRVIDIAAAEAFKLAEANHDAFRAARAAIQALDALFRSPGGVLDAGEWLARADRYAADGSVERVYADCHLGLHGVRSRRPSEGARYLRRSIELASQLNDDTAYMTAAGMCMSFLNGLQDADLLDHLVGEYQTRSRGGARTLDMGLSLDALARSHLERGDRAEAERLWSELADIANQSDEAAAVVQADIARATLAFIDGRLEDAALFRDVEKRLTEVRGVALGAANRAKLLGSIAAVYMGSATTALLADFEATSRVGRVGMADHGLMLAFLGFPAEALAIRSEFGDLDADDDTSKNILVTLLAMSIMCGDHSTAAVLVRRLSPLAGRVQGWHYVTSYGRLLGEASAALGRSDDARDYFRRALDASERIRFRPEMALIRLDLAELLLQAFPAERTEAVEHCRVAVSELRAMHMQPSLERALRLSESQQGGEAEPAAPRSVSTPADGLTAREREVARLVARGSSNRQIAEALVISEGTAEVHVKHILAKLGFRSRAQVASWATSRGLAGD